MSLKARVLFAVAVIAFAMAGVAVAVTHTTTAYLVAQLDTQLVRFAGPRDRAPAVPRAAPTATFTELPATIRWFETPSSTRVGTVTQNSFTTLYVGVFDGGKLRTSIRPGGAASPAVPAVGVGTARALAANGDVVTVGSADGVRYRVTAFVSADGNLAVLGVPRTDVDAAIRRLVVVEVVAGLLILVVLGLIALWVIRLGVRPVRRMTAAAAAVGGGDLSQRIPDAPAGTEAGALGDALNAMLGRIAVALDERAASEGRLRRFLADASHELRTPVTTIRGYAELYRTGALADAHELDTAMRRTEAESVRLTRLVADMTLLARLEQTRPRERAPVSLDAVVADAAADFRVRHGDRVLHADLEPVIVLGDVDELHQVVANLLDNAAVHTPPGSPVEVLVKQAGGVGRVQVVDHGPGVDAETAVRAFERFYRADPSRNRASGGSGLGLSIAATIVSAHGGTVRMDARGADDTRGAGTTVVVEVPAVAAVRPPAGADAPVVPATVA